MKYELYGDVYENKKDLDDAIEEYAEGHYDEMLDEIYGEVNVCGYTYSSSHALHQLDLIAYRCGLSDYESTIRDDVKEIEEDDEEEG